jgi:hypothetical protein
MRTLVALGVLAVATAMLGRTFGLHDVRFLGAELLLLASMLAISRWVLPLVERRDRGAQGEEHVGELLSALTDDGWLVIHDASLGRGNVDHILIGPPGVFTIETKSNPGPVRVSRLHGGLLAQAQAQSRALKQACGVTAEPLVVFSRAWVDRPGSRRKGVRVLPSRMLVGYLSKREARLSEAEMARAHELIAEALLAHESRGRLVHERWQLIR